MMTGNSKADLLSGTVCWMMPQQWTDESGAFTAMLPALVPHAFLLTP